MDLVVFLHGIPSCTAQDDLTQGSPTVQKNRLLRFACLEITRSENVNLGILKFEVSGWRIQERPERLTQIAVNQLRELWAVRENVSY